MKFICSKNFSLPSNRTLNYNFSFSNPSLILVVAHSIYKTFIVSKLTQNMSYNHLVQKYHIGLSFNM
jgi:hypothetical protein